MNNYANRTTDDNIKEEDTEGTLHNLPFPHQSGGRRSPHTTIHRPTHHPAKTHPSGHVFRVVNGHIEGSTGGHAVRVQEGGGGSEGVQLRNGRCDGAKLVGVRDDGAHGREETGGDGREESYSEGKETEGREREEKEKEEEQYSKEIGGARREEEKEEESDKLSTGERRETEEMKGNNKKKQEENEEEEKEEDYAIFDEFLDVSTRARLRQMAGKVEALTQALHLAQEECRQMVSQYQVYLYDATVCTPLYNDKRHCKASVMYSVCKCILIS